MSSNCGTGEDFSKSLGQQDLTSQSSGKSTRVLIGRTDAEAEALVFWSSDLNRCLIGKVPYGWKVWRQKKGVSDDEIAGWRHWCNGCELGQTLGDGEGQEAWRAQSMVSQSQTWLGDWTAIDYQNVKISQTWLLYFIQEVHDNGEERKTNQ